MDFLFPHENYRKIQESFMTQVFHVIKNKGQLLAHAPTGIGKTASALSPALTYVLKENPKKTIFFLTSRNTQHLIAVETLKKIRNKYQIDIVAVDLVGKKGMCNQPGTEMHTSGEFAEYCKALREKNECQYFNNLKEKGKNSLATQNILHKLKKESPLHVEEINSVCFNADVCSYEIACMLGKDAHIIIADYNYILNPNIRDSLFKRSNKTLSDCIIIFDEGHNVPMRARDLLTATLSVLTLDYAAREAKTEGFEEISYDLLAIKTILETIAKEKITMEKDEALLKKEDFFTRVEAIGKYEEIMGNCVFVGEQVLKKKKRSAVATVGAFMEQWRGPDEGFTRIITRKFSKGAKPTMQMQYRCLDPGIVMRPILKEAHATILMSGTLTPLEMYVDLLDFDKDNTISLEYNNPFPSENKLSIILPETSTKFQTRSSIMYGHIAEKCASIVNTVPGNSVVFFPSYSLRDAVYQTLKEKCEKTMFLEETECTKKQRGNLLERFKGYKDQGAVLLAVAGGSFSEGIDLPGDLLKCVIVVGLPLARPDLETQELINYYDKRFGKGWDYGYVYPAIIKILQSAGRCIRSETDRGVVVFVDERYVWQNYKKCFPSDMQIQIEKNPVPLIQQFFSK